MSQTLTPLAVLPLAIRRRHVEPPLSGPRRAAEYRAAFGLPAVVDPATGQILMRAGAIVAVMLPADLGQQLRVLLERAGESWPILAHPRSQTWTFLTDRDQPTSDITSRSGGWWRERVSVLTANAVVGLPSPRVGGIAHREWVIAPDGKARPATSTVLDALSELLSPGGWR